MTPTELKSALEAIIYAADEPATVEQLATVLDEEKQAVRAAFAELVASYASDERGVEIRTLTCGYFGSTKPQISYLARCIHTNLRPPLPLTIPPPRTPAYTAYT